MSSPAGLTANDELDGGDGIDRVWQEVDANQTLTNSLLTGEGPDSLVSIERATLIGGGSANVIDATLFTLGSVTLIGKGGNDTLLGSPADDFLQGDDGDDTLDGRAGSDTYVFVGAGLGTDTIVEPDNQDSDTLDFSGFTQSVSVDLLVPTPQTVNAGQLVLVLGGSAAIENVIGSSYGDILWGNGRDNLLEGGDGDDQLHGRDGNDVLLGGRGNDTLFGDVGSDILSGGLGDDLLDGGAGTDRLSEAGSGDFTLTNSSLTGVGSDILGELEVANLTGDAGPNRFTVSGWTGTGTLDGAGGSNTVLSTNDANFTLTDSSLSVSGGASFSLIDITLALLTGGVGTNTLDASAFTGTTTLKGEDGPDTLRGGSGSDSLFGGAGVDTLSGGAGHDFLDGGTGGDQLSGNAGDDTYRFADNWGTDSVVECPARAWTPSTSATETTGVRFQRGAVTLSASDLAGNGINVPGDDVESLIGGSGGDTFVFDNGVSLAGGAGLIDGRSGSKTLDYRPSPPRSP